MNENHLSSHEISKDILKMRYEELTTCLWNALHMYYKACYITFVLIGVALGYLFKVPLAPAYGRIISLVILILGALGYVATGYGFVFYKSVTSNIRATGQALGISYDPKQYVICKVVLIASMIVFSPILIVFLYFLFKPLTVG